MGTLSWIIFGALTGWAASKVMGKNASMGLIVNIVVGIVGASIGGFVMNSLGGHGVTGFNFKSFLVALLGAIILLAIVNLLTKGRLR